MHVDGTRKSCSRRPRRWPGNIIVDVGRVDDVGLRGDAEQAVVFDDDAAGRSGRILGGTAAGGEILRGLTVSCFVLKTKRATTETPGHEILQLNAGGQCREQTASMRYATKTWSPGGGGKVRHCRNHRSTVVRLGRGAGGGTGAWSRSRTGGGTGGETGALASKAPTNLGNILRAASMSYASDRACQGVGKWHGGHGCRYRGWSLILTRQLHGQVD